MACIIMKLPRSRKVPTLQSALQRHILPITSRSKYSHLWRECSENVDFTVPVPLGVLIMYTNSSAAEFSVEITERDAVECRVTISCLI
jgi:hypothetical protein